jgi:hypothetical protein
MVDNIASHNNINLYSVKPQTVGVEIMTNHNNANNSFVKPQTVAVDNVKTQNEQLHC